jgi:hypothetical protein
VSQGLPNILSNKTGCSGFGLPWALAVGVMLEDVGLPQ